MLSIQKLSFDQRIPSKYESSPAFLFLFIRRRDTTESDGATFIPLQQEENPSIEPAAEATEKAVIANLV